jgi:DNA-binding CsgD family transcriptional regulator
MTGAKEPQRSLFPQPADAAASIQINDRCLIHTEQDYRIVIVSGIPLAQYAVGDYTAESYSMVNLVEQGWASQKEVARAFGCSTRSVRRYRSRMDEGGLPALGRSRGYPAKRPRISHARERMVGQLKAQGEANKEIARRLGVTPKAIRKLLKRIGWHGPEPEQCCLPIAKPGGDPKLSAFAPPVLDSTPEKPSLPDEHVSLSFDSDPADRRVDRLLAYLGMLDDAAPLFPSAAHVPRGGVILALPALVDSGIFTITRKIYGSIGPAFYGLRTTFITLLLMALLRIKRPESLKEHSPVDLGKVLGLDRAPEVKTLRRKLSRLASFGRAADLARDLALKRVEDRGAAMGFLYVDGHVRVYHGKRTLPKAHVARRRLAMPATTDYWVNDMAGDPVFVVTAEANAGMVKMLPTVLGQVRAMVGERRITVVFDRGGFSPKLFLQLVAGGFDILTYRKGASPRVAKSKFSLCKGMIDGQTLSYVLADQEVNLLNGKLRLRQVTRLRDDHQTPIVTSRRDLLPMEVAFRMFERWRQENFFKYLREEYALDALVDYDVVPDNPDRDVPNPKRAESTFNLLQAKAEFERLTAEYGADAFMSAEQGEPSSRQKEATRKQLAKKMREAFDRITDLEQKRSRIPARVPVGVATGKDVVKLDPERKLLTNLVKMIAYQAESDLVHLVSPYYRRASDEGRTLIQSALAASADIQVTGDELRVLLAPLSSLHRTRAIAELSEELNQNPVFYPGTRLRLKFGVAGLKSPRKRTIS